MTLKTSLFNKGIYKSTVKRYAWGSVLYFISLFISTSLTLLLSKESILRHEYLEYTQRAGSLILQENYFLIPILLSFFVPTVVSLLCFRFIHTKKAAVFTHALPVTRTSAYVSTLLAAFTLMFIPVLLNGLILILLSISGFSVVFDVGSCFVWMGIIILALFLMFSVACFSAFITGNSFALVVLNGLLHGIYLLIAALMSRAADIFLYGYSNTYLIRETLVKWNFITFIMKFINIGSRDREPVDFTILIAFVVVALLLYLISWLLYKKRNMEKAEDVAGYNCLNYIFKYFVTFVLSLCAIGVYGGYIKKSPVIFCLILLFAEAMGYFGTEMLLRKTFRVWKTYKGYIGYTAIFGALFCMFAFTSFFGFETRVPDTADIEAVSIVIGYEYYEPDRDLFVHDEYVNHLIVNIHKDKIMPENMRTVSSTHNYGNTITLTYLLKNGSLCSRTYSMNDTEFFNMYEGLYKSEEYKRKYIELMYSDMQEIKGASINGVSLKRVSEDLRDEFVSALKKDTLMLDYSQTHMGSPWNVEYIVDYTNDSIREQSFSEVNKYWSLHGSINSNYVNTLELLKKHGYEDALLGSFNETLVLLTAEQWKEYSNKQAADINKATTVYDIEDAKIIEDDSTKETIGRFVIYNGEAFEPGREYACYICSVNREDNTLTLMAAFYDELSEKLMKDINN